MDSTIFAGSMVQDYYENITVKLCDKRRKLLQNINTPAAAIDYVREVRAKITAAFAPFPAKTPLNTHISSSTTLDGITIEKIYFESRPNFFVTALFFKPAKIAAEQKIPAVLMLCGHANEGKAFDCYQIPAMNLAQKGFAVLMPDPISQGERFQFEAVADAADFSGFCVSEHNMIGKGLLLCDEFFGTWRVWDAIRAVDLLLERPEVDINNIAVTGNSGGGTLSSYAFALDERIKFAAPSCFIASYEANVKNELPADVEQLPPGLLASGCEMADFIIARAPAPAIILGKSNDFFDCRATAQAYEEAKKIYTLLNAADKIELFIGEGDHGFTVDNRQAMYGFFTKHIKNNSDNTEKLTSYLPDLATYATSAGRVSNLPNAITVPDYLIKRSAELSAKRQNDFNLSKLRNSLTKEFQLDSSAIALPEVNTLRQVLISESHEINPEFLSLFAIRSEAGIKSYLHFFSDRPYFQIPRLGEECTLYVSHLDAENELLSSRVIPQNNSTPLFALDVRGIGKSRPTTCDRSDNYFEFYKADYFFAANSLLNHHSYLGGKIRDLISTIKLLNSAGYQKINLSGRGLGGLVTLYAAILLDDKDFNHITLYNTPLSFSMMLQHKVWLWPQSHIFRGLLTQFDLPELYNALAKKLTLVTPHNHLFTPYTRCEFDQEAAAVKLSTAIKVSDFRKE